MTWEHPGSPGYWYADSGCNNQEGDSDGESVSHLEILTNDDDMQTVIDRIAIESWDNIEACVDVWW